MVSHPILHSTSHMVEPNGICRYKRSEHWSSTLPPYRRRGRRLDRTLSPPFLSTLTTLFAISSKLGLAPPGRGHFSLHQPGITMMHRWLFYPDPAIWLRAGIMGFVVWFAAATQPFGVFWMLSSWSKDSPIKKSRNAYCFILLPQDRRSGLTLTISYRSLLTPMIMNSTVATSTSSQQFHQFCFKTLFMPFFILCTIFIYYYIIYYLLL